LNRRPKPSAKPSKLLPALLAIAILAAGFATLMVRLELTEEGYRLSALRIEVSKLEDENERLKLDVAELSSHERLRALAAKYRLESPARGRVVMMP
jgi:cell division protein FtsL